MPYVDAYCVSGACCTDQAAAGIVGIKNHHCSRSHSVYILLQSLIALAAIPVVAI